MDELFLRFIPIILNNECGKGNGYVNDKDDSGGETIYGIVRKFYPKLEIWKSLDNIKGVREKKSYQPTEEEMNEIFKIYYLNYYKPCLANLFNDNELGLQVFDFAVNAGVKQAIKTLQKVLRISMDGICGRQTITTANVKRGVLEAYKMARVDFYVEISKKGNNKKFLQGWVNRVANTHL